MLIGLPAPIISAANLRVASQDFEQLVAGKVVGRIVSVSWAPSRMRHS